MTSWSRRRTASREPSAARPRRGLAFPSDPPLIPTYVPAFGRRARELSISINGVDLIDLLREHESLYEPCIAGRYLGLPLDTVRPPSPHLLGSPCDPSYSRDGRTALLVCRECGVVECWGFFARITFHDEVVVWDGLTQPRRPRWRYHVLEPFVFTRELYEAAVRGLAGL